MRDERGLSFGCWVSEQVATLAPNVPAAYELHFAFPMAGAILCTLTARHDPSMVLMLLKHLRAKIIFVDCQLLEVARQAIDLFNKTETEPPALVQRPHGEWDPISVNYTSRTTSQPKGVVYSHRGAYLKSIVTFLLHGMGSIPVYLWTVPMFHCNGWCLTWGAAAQGSTNVCLRKVSPKGIFDSIAMDNMTHMEASLTVEVMTGGSLPPPQILSKMEGLGFSVSHLYGLTETYGPGTYCAWKPEWDSLSSDQRSSIKSRQWVQHLGLEEVDIRDTVTMESVPSDGKSLGEIMFRGNTVVSGYYKNQEAMDKAFEGGWFHSGDLAVKHPDGYIEVKDRLKDVIISGGENISTVEVETVLYSHPAVLEAAVVARPDNHWGQTPCAFVKLKEGCHVDAQEIIGYCRDHL
ncbi:hypothetical protein EUGRSUZ_I02237 [Eucalyptus grandis]|uniref:AMP-dependent synthetase/ligase domain-containing protein n=2 Tax=Eucalyptus grandis TaxID=71139 RepID=A0A059ARY7_EUCGR|nr:hypothetical protein EUGRSUZ_I02237 [Eucalyptus grandis]